MSATASFPSTALRANGHGGAVHVTADTLDGPADDLADAAVGAKLAEPSLAGAEGIQA